MLILNEIKESINEIPNLTVEEVKEQYFAKGRNVVSQTESLSLHNVDLCSAVFEILSIYGRTEEIRKIVHQDNPTIFNTLIKFYLLVQEELTKDPSSKQFINSKIQLLRAIGNLAIDDDEARQRILETEGIPKIIKDLNSEQDLSIMKFLTGCLLNISLGYAPIRQNMLKENCIQALMFSISPLNLEKGQDTTVYFGLRQLSNLFDEDDGPKIFAQNYENLRQLIGILDFYANGEGNHDIPILEHVVEIIELILTENEPFQARFLKDQSYFKLINFIRQSNKLKNKYMDSEKEFKEICTIIKRIIVLVSSHDENLELFDCKPFMNDMLNWLIQDEEPQLKSCSALIIGNLVRNEENCLKAVNVYKLHEKIYNILKDSNDLNIQHAMVGLLKNICIPVKNKDIIGELPLIKIISPFLEKLTAPPLQYNTVGVLKHLSNRNERNALALCDEVNSNDNILPITRLRKVIDKSDNQGVRSEGTRALINVIKSVCNTKENYVKYGKLLSDNTAVKAVIDLVKQTQFPILQNEGLLALIIIVITKSPDIQAIIDALEEEVNEEKEKEKEDTNLSMSEQQANKILPLYEALNDIIHSESKPYAEEMRMNVSTFVTQILEHVKNDGNPTVKRKLEKLLSYM